MRSTAGGGEARTIIPIEVAAISLPHAVWRERQLEMPEESWRGKTVGVDTATREVFLGESSADIPKGPTVILVQVSKLDLERRRLRLGGRWRRVK